MGYSSRDTPFLRDRVKTQEEMLELCFDDEPLDRILYGKKLKGPSRANLFWPALEYSQRIRSAFKEENIEEVLEMASELSSKAHKFSTGMCFDLAMIMKSIIPQYPNPVIETDLRKLCLLLEQMWNHALKTKDIALQRIVGDSLYRLYEHHHQYEDARRVLTRLTEIYREAQHRHDEAAMINNFAYGYLLERRWKEAVPLFEKAARIFEENGDIMDSANSRANYWTCRFECDDFKEMNEMEAELKELVKILRRSAIWHKRKPFILLARIEESKGYLAAAILFVKQAIETSGEAKIRDTELDRRYLKDLRAKANF